MRVIYLIILIFSCIAGPAIGNQKYDEKYSNISKYIYSKLLFLLKKRDPIHSHHMKLIIKNFKNIQITCTKPHVLLLPHSPRWGKMNVVVICNRIKKIIQFDLQIYGKYLIANKNIKFGKNISMDDIKITTGRLDKLSFFTCLDSIQVINNISSCNIRKNEPILFSMFHKPWLIKMYQRVPVLIKGECFIVISEGKALNNAFKNDMIDVLMKNGKTITGIVNSNGEIIVLNEIIF